MPVPQSFVITPGPVHKVRYWQQGTVLNWQPQRTLYGLHTSTTHVFPQLARIQHQHTHIQYKENELKSPSSLLQVSHAAYAFHFSKGDVGAPKHLAAGSLFVPFDCSITRVKSQLGQQSSTTLCTSRFDYLTDLQPPRQSLHSPSLLCVTP